MSDCKPSIGPASPATRERALRRWFFQFFVTASLVGTLNGFAHGDESDEDAVTKANGNILAVDSKQLSFQAALTDAAGDPLPGDTVVLSFMTWDVDKDIPLEGPIVVKITDMVDGVVDVQIPIVGKGFDGRALALGVSIEGEPEMTPRIPLTSVPYAFRVNRVASAELDDRISLGDSSNEGKLTLFSSDGTDTVEIEGEDDGIKGGVVRLRTSTGVDSITLRGELHTLTVIGRDGFAAVTVSGSLVSGAGTVSVYGADGSTKTCVLEGRSLAVTSTGGRLSLSNDAGSMRAQLEAGRSNAGFLTLRDGITKTVELDGGADAPGSLLRMSTPSGNETVILQSTETGADGGQLVLSQADETSTVVIDAEESGGGGVVQLFNSNGIQTIELDADEGDDGVLRVNDASGNTRLEMLSDLGSSTHGGALQLYNGANERTILLDADDDGANAPSLRMYTNNGTSLIPSVIIDADFGSTTHGAAIFLYNDAGDLTIEIDADESDNAGAIRMYDSTGAQTIVLDPAYSGSGRVITGVLQLTGGSDVSEQFDIANPRGPVEPGMVVSIDATKPGKLIVSETAYDRTVAGVISGAGGVNPGFLMGQTGSIADGAIPVALTGRVWTMCEATEVAITPGAMLTTSSRPGHAMAAADYDRARGAIIGKAMTGLDSGTGLVLVLIQPQ